MEGRNKYPLRTLKPLSDMGEGFGKLYKVVKKQEEAFQKVAGPLFFNYLISYFFYINVLGII